MDKKMCVSRFVNAFWELIILLVIFLSSCGTNRTSIPDYQRMSIAQLEQRLYKEYDLECFTELVTRSFYDVDLDVKKYARFITDSLGGINALTFVGSTLEECAYYLALNEAYGIDDAYVEIFGVMLVKDIINDYLNPLFVNDVLCDTSIDSLEKRIMEYHDTLAYWELRNKTSFLELKTCAQFLADSVCYTVAIQDMYNIICTEYWDGYPMDSAAFALADYYLEKGVALGYLPSVFQKSLLLLMGVYLPQDTIKGKELLDKCLINPPCATPFWRYVPKEK